jgi:dTMP kinase
MDIPLDEARQRTRQRDGDTSDRIGGRNDAFHQNVRDAFRRISTQEPDRVRIVEASGTPDEIASRIFNQIADLLP